MAELKLDELTQAMAAAVKAGMDEHEHERKQAEGRGTAEDPLTKEAIDAQIDAQVNAKLAEVEKAYDEKLARIQAESKRVDPDAVKHGLGDVWPLPVGRLVRKARNEAEKAAQDLSDIMHVIGKLAIDPVKAARAYLDSEDLHDTSVHKAIDTYTSTGASEWVPTIFSGQMIADIDDKARVAPLFTRIPMAGKNVTMPGGSGLPTVYRTTGAENATTRPPAGVMSTTSALTGSPAPLSPSGPASRTTRAPGLTRRPGLSSTSQVPSERLEIRSISTLPPVGTLCPKRRAGMTRLSLATSRSPGRR